LALTIAEKNAGNPMDRLLLADAYGIKPSSSVYRELIRSTNQYGLIKGNEKSDYIALTDLGLAYGKPVQPGEREAKVLQIIQKPELAARVYRHFDRNRWPDQGFLKNLLERQFGVSPHWSAWTAEVLEKNAQVAGAIRTISGSAMLIMSGSNGSTTESTGSGPPSSFVEGNGHQEDSLASSGPFHTIPPTGTDSATGARPPGNPASVGRIGAEWKVIHIDDAFHVKVRADLDAVEDLMNHLELFKRSLQRNQSRAASSPRSEEEAASSPSNS